MPIASSHSNYDAVIVGSGPNGLTAAATLAREGLSVLVVEAESRPGGGTRSEQLTVPGFVHDHCSAVHPLGIASPIFRSLELERYGLQWIQPSAPLAHVLGEERAITLERSVDETARQLGRDGARYRSLVTPFVEDYDAWIEMVLGPLRIPRKPLLLARFGLLGVRSLEALADARFREAAAGALLGGIAMHATLPLDAPLSTAFALVLAITGHTRGWPIARRGSQSISDALVGCVSAHGGEFDLRHRVQNVDELPPARAYLLDLTPKQIISIAGHHLPPIYRWRLGRFHHGPGVCKLDWALREPIPWRNQACRRAGTVHLSGDLKSIAHGAALVHGGKAAPAPFVLVVQPTLFDPSRAPNGMHTAWAYCHVPNGSDIDASQAIEAEIERHAPGFRECVIARSTMNALDLERGNPNLVGGDISGGTPNLTQLFSRPVARIDPYTTPASQLFVCSSSTPPGGAVHGMCGYWAARSALAHVFERSSRGALRRTPPRPLPSSDVTAPSPDRASTTASGR